MASTGLAETEDFLFTVDTGISTFLTIGLEPIYNYSGVINWGDGSPEEAITGFNNFSISHTFPANGLTQVRVSGSSVPSFGFGGSSNLVSVENFGIIGWTDIYSMFSGCENLVSFNAGNTDTSSVTTALGMFADCVSLSSANLSTFDTSQVTVINSMFHNCNSLTTLDLSNWDTSNVGYFVNAFRGCTSLGTLLLPDNFVTSSALQMIAVFYDCQSLQNLDVSTWDTSNVRSMNAIFVRCFGLTDIVGLETNIRITGLNVTSGLTNTANNVPDQGTDYDALLINWEANLPTSGLAQSPKFNLCKVTTTAGNDARNSLINNYNWVIADRGPL